MNNTSVDIANDILKEPLEFSLEIYNVKGKPVLHLKKQIYDLDKINALLKAAFSQNELLATFALKDRFAAHQKIKVIESQTGCKLLK